MAERLVRGFSNLIATIQDRQLTSTNNNILVPFYTVIVSGGQRVYESYAVMPFIHKMYASLLFSGTGAGVGALMYSTPSEAGICWT